MYSPAAIENAPAASPASPASSTALLSALPPATPAISAKLETSPSEAPNTAGRSQPPVTSECSCWMRSLVLGRLRPRSVVRSAARRSSRSVVLLARPVRRRRSPAVGVLAGLRLGRAQRLERPPALAAGPPPGADDEVGDRAEEDEEAGPVVQPQPEEVVGRVDAQGLDPAAADGVGRDVERERPAVAEPEAPVGPDDQAGDAEVPERS